MEKTMNTEKLVFALAFLVLGTMAFNIFLQGELSQQVVEQKIQIQYLSLSQNTAQQSNNSNTAENTQTVISFEEFLPKGVPAIYGTELGVSFDKPVESLAVMQALDGDLYQDGKLKFSDLDDASKQDFIKIGMSISCEYCCGAEYIVAPNGQPACGCAHSAAMRGLIKYLLINHRGDYTNEQILEQLTLWKTMFFPKQMYQKTIQLQAEGGSLTGTVLDEIPDMVGGC
ncbi:MAG: hypothetical protein NUV57_01250 [archaeon]|nr:hypothetical protein [archaeon]